jgi:hypothetical protein
MMIRVAKFAVSRPRTARVTSRAAKCRRQRALDERLMTTRTTRTTRSNEDSSGPLSLAVSPLFLRRY